MIYRSRAVALRSHQRHTLFVQVDLGYPGSLQGGSLQRVALGQDLLVDLRR